MKKKTPTCGVEMLQGLEGRRELHYRPLHIRCDLEPGHRGNHSCKMPIASFTWWNEQDNPQQIPEKAMDHARV